MKQTFIYLSLFLLSCGCTKSLEDQAKKSPDSIMNKTQDPGKFDPNAGAKISDSKVHVTDPILAGPQAFGPMLEQINTLHVKHAIDIFQANNDRYPKDNDEFMTEIIKANGIKLPVLPGGKKFQYDEANHVLVVVDGSDEKK